MKSKTVVLAATAALALGISSAAPGAAPSAIGHCRADEQVVFSCKVKSGKVVSICAAGQLSASGAGTVRMQYRFGRRGAPEMLFPAQPETPNGLFFLSTVMYGGGGDERIGFRTGGYNYFVYQRDIAGEWNTDGTRGHFQDEGVIVTKGDRVISLQICGRGSLSNDGFPKMYDVLQREDWRDLDIPCCGQR